MHELTPDDAWAWAREEPDEQPELTPDATGVVAVMVVHNAEGWLEGQLLALSELTPRPGWLVAVDNGSTDASPQLLEQAASTGVLDSVVTIDHNSGFAAAVDAVVPMDAEWIWLLHDDSAPRRDALAALLRGAHETGAGIVVPKLLQPRRRNHPDMISEVGQTITRSGRRVSLGGPGDVDQLQHTPREVLGGSTAGMLIRGDLWRDLGGLAPELPGHRDGVELGWRAVAGGHTVTTWPDAVLRHRQASHQRERDVPAHADDRLAALRVIASRGEKPPGRFRLTLASWARSLVFLLGKSPSMARAELRALRAFRSQPEAVANLAARCPAENADVAALLAPKDWGWRQVMGRTAESATDQYRSLTGAEADTSLDELTSDDAQHQSRERFSPTLMLVLLLIAGGLLAGRTLLGGAVPSGGGLLPAPKSLGEAWAAFTTALPGVGGSPPAWLGWSALLSSLTLGQPWLVSVLSLVAIPLLAALSMRGCLRRFGLTQGRAAAGALTWAAATLLLGLVTAGDISGMALSVVLPHVLRSARRMHLDGSSGVEQFRAPASLAFWLLLGGLFWPFLLVLSTVGVLLWWWRERERWPVALVAGALPWVGLVPSAQLLLAHPGRMLTGVDPLAWAARPPASVAMLAGRILPSGLPLWANVVFFAGLGLVALHALAGLSTRMRLLVGGAIACPLLVGVWLSRIQVGVLGGEARPLLSAWALLSVAGLVWACVISPRWGRGTGTVLALGGTLAVGTWAWFGFQGPVQSGAQELPNYVRGVVDSPRHTRVLMVEATDDLLRWNVVEQGQPVWGSGEHGPVPAFADQFATIVQALWSGNAPEDLGQQLTDIAVSHLWLRGFSEDRLAAIGNVAGLTRATAGEDTVVWTVTGLTSRAVLIEGEQTTPVADGVVPDGGERELRLAEEPDPRRRVWVGDVALEAVPGKDSVWVVPAGVSGELRQRVDAPVWGWVVLAAGVLLVAALAAPTVGQQPTARARRGKR